MVPPNMYTAREIFFMAQLPSFIRVVTRDSIEGEHRPETGKTHRGQCHRWCRMEFERGIRIMSNSEEFLDTSTEVPVRGYIHRSASPNSDGLILTHGAGANCNSPLLIS